MIVATSLTPFFMKQTINFRQQIKHFKRIFDVRTYGNFVAVVEGMMKLREWKQADLALVGEKTLRQIQYFFEKAVWSARSLNEFRLRFLRNKPDFRDRKTDFVVGDGSVLEKDKDASFSFLTESVYSNLEGKVVKGIKLFGASVHTKQGVKYIFDFFLYFKGKWKSEWEAWMYFLALIAKKTTALLFVFDRGFRNQYLLKYIFKDLKRLFLIRIDPAQHIYVLASKRARKRKKIPRYSIPDRISKRLDYFLNQESAITLENGKLWILNEVIVKAWIGEFREEVSVIVFHRNGFKNPLVICISVPKLTLEEALDYLETYFRRWGIEQLFKELKSWFCFEKFKTISLESIEKYLAMVIFVHSLLTQVKEQIEHVPKLKEAIQSFLKKVRNITVFTMIGFKLFLEIIFLSPTSLKFIKPYLKAHYFTFIR